jgi:hypothetical protein
MSFNAVDYQDDFNISVTLELEVDTPGFYKAILHWPTGNLYTQTHIDLSEIIGKDYYTSSAHWAESSVSVNPAHQDLRLKIQRENGELLAKAIFVGNLLGILSDLSAIARDRTVLFTVYYQDELLDRVPWELLGDPSLSLMKNFNLSLSVSRGILHTDPKTPRGQKRIRVVYVTSQPLPYHAFHSEEEIEAIHKTIGSNQKFEFIPYPGKKITHTEFHKFIRDTRPHILHMALHGENGKLLFSRKSDDQPVLFRTLAREISEVGSVGLVILNVCYSGAMQQGGQEDELFIPSLPRQLVERGIPCSIGMGTKITDLAVTEFTEWLYIGMAECKSVRKAFHAAIEALRGYNRSDHILWSVPMLYLNQDTVPLVDFLEALLVEPSKPEFDKQFFQKVISVCEECIRASEAIQPSSYWDAVKWRNETAHLLLILFRTKELVSMLEYKIPRTDHLVSRDQMTQILRCQKDAKKSLQELENSIPNWTSMDISDAGAGQALQIFMTRVRAAAHNLYSLKEVVSNI